MLFRGAGTVVIFGVQRYQSRTDSPSRMTARGSRLLNLTNARMVFGYMLGLLSSGCAMIEEAHDDGMTSRSIVFAAPINVLPPLPDQGRVVRMTGVGLAVSNGMSTLGYFNNTETVLNPKCQIVLVGNTDDQLTHFAEITGDAKTLCSDNVTRGAKK